MKHTTVLLAATLALTAPHAKAVTWDFVATDCFGQFPPNACTGVPATPFVLGTFSAEGSGSSTFVSAVAAAPGVPERPASGGGDFSMDFGPLFVVVDGIPIPNVGVHAATDWNIAWGPDGKPTTIVFNTLDSNLRFRGDRIETASDSPDLVGCRTLADCVFSGYWIDDKTPTATAAPEPGTMGLMLVALLGLFGFRWSSLRRSGVVGEVA